MPAEYGIVANVTETDRVFRKGVKAWMAYCYSGGERVKWIAMSRSGRVVEKVSPTSRFENFRCKWIPENLREHIIEERGDRAQMEGRAAFWNARAKEARGDHPNRRQ